MKVVQQVREGPTFPPPGWCFMLSEEPILERALRTPAAGAVLGLAVGFKVAVVEDVPEEVGFAVRGTEGFFSGTVPVVEDGVAGLVVVVRLRKAAVVEVVVRVVVIIFGLVESAGDEKLS